MALKDLLIPILTGAAGAGASYWFLGTTKSSQGKRSPKEGIEPWAVALGGGLVGYIAGQFITSKLAPAPTAAAGAGVQAPLATTQSGQGEYLDLDRPVRRALPPGPTPAPAKLEQVDVRAAGSDDSDMLESYGSFEGVGEDGLGSYGLDVDVDAIDVDALMREAGHNRN